MDAEQMKRIVADAIETAIRRTDSLQSGVTRAPKDAGIKMRWSTERDRQVTYRLVEKTPQVFGRRDHFIMDVVVRHVRGEVAMRASMGANFNAAIGEGSQGFKTVAW